MYIAKFYLSTKPIAFLHAKAEIILKVTRINSKLLGLR